MHLCDIYMNIVILFSGFLGLLFTQQWGRKHCVISCLFPSWLSSYSRHAVIVIRSRYRCRYPGQSLTPHGKMPNKVIVMRGTGTDTAVYRRSACWTCLWGSVVQSCLCLIKIHVRRWCPAKQNHIIYSNKPRTNTSYLLDSFLFLSSTGSKMKCSQSRINFILILLLL